MDQHFLYPSVHSFPFDKACETIVRALEQRNWRVRGTTVTFRSYGPGNAYRMVDTIQGTDFRLHFGRPQRRLDERWNDVAAISDMVIPSRKQLYVFQGEAGPTLYVYVGKNWRQDRGRFMTGSKVLSKLHEEERWYLKYSGVCRCGNLGAHRHKGRRTPVLAYDNDLGRDYDPVGDEPRQYLTSNVYAEFATWLNEELLMKRILGR